LDNLQKGRYPVELSETPTTEPGSIRDTVSRLISWSRRHSWGLARVEYISEFARERVLSSLRYTLAEQFIPLQEIELPPYRSASEIVQFLVEQLRKIDSGVVSISGFATAFKSETHLEDSLRVLNFNRENLVPPTLRQIWWLPSSFAEVFVPAVPDLDSWFTIRLYLTEAVPSPSAAPAGSDYQRADQLSNIPPRNPLFTGRDAALSSIRKELETSGIVTINGLGGMGKTQTSFEYAHRHRHDYKTLLWTLADNEDSLRRGLLRMAVLLDLPEVQEKDQNLAIEAVRRWLEHNDDWLLILDELVETGHILPSLLSRSQKGHILATSRRSLIQSRPAIDLSTMTAEESRTLLFKRAGRQPSNAEEAIAADNITAEMGYVPLTLELAGAYIQKERISFGDYLMLYRDYSLDSKMSAESPFTLVHAVELSFRELQGPVQSLLRVCSFLNPDEIPRELLMRSLELLPNAYINHSTHAADRPTEILRTVASYSLMRQDVFSATYTMHRLIQAIIRDLMDTE
jgi:hypothetical protein